MKRKVDCTNINSFFTITPKSKLAECIICNKFFKEDFIESHTNSCIEEKLNKNIEKNIKENLNNENEKKNDLFKHMMESSSANTIQNVHFELILKDGKLFPSFYFDNETLINDDSIIRWSEELKVKKFRTICSEDFSDDIKYEDLKLTLATNISSSSSSSSSSSTYPLHHSLLKSMLQKAVRRRLDISVLRLSKELANLSLIEFLRRLPIIIIEDTILHPAYPIIVWLMMAIYKGFNPPECLVAICIGVIYEVSLSEYKDIYYLDEDIDLNIIKKNINENSNDLDVNLANNNSNLFEDKNITPQSNNTNKFNVIEKKKILSNHPKSLRSLPMSPSRTLIISLNLRACFGGMKGDIIMLERFSCIWFDRLFNNEEINKLKFNENENELNSNSQISLAMENYLHITYLLDISKRGHLLTLSTKSNLNSSSSLLTIINLNNTWGNSILKSFHFELKENYSTPLFEYICLNLFKNLDLIWNWDNISVNKSLYFDIELKDLVIFGIDFHCDFGLIPFIIKSIEENNDIKKIEKNTDINTLIKETIWSFRSSINTHKVWLITETEIAKNKEFILKESKQKKSLSHIWCCICKIISMYSINKCDDLFKKLLLYKKFSK